jgi:trehalose 6-phosphate phosphatase
MALPLPAIPNDAEWAFFLDFDGTLVDIAERPDQVRVPPDLVGLLQRMVHRFSGAVSILTGRTVADADRLLAPLRLAMAGVHGAELRTRTDGDTGKLHTPIDPALIEEVEKLRRLSPKLIIENKGRGVAVHFRRIPEAGPAVEAALAELVQRSHGKVELRSGRMVCEIVSAGTSKDKALEHLSALPPFNRCRPVMIGDDRTDAAAIALAARMGGCGLKVCGEHFGAEECHFDNPSQVRSWLRSLVTGAT